MTAKFSFHNTAETISGWRIMLDPTVVESKGASDGIELTLLDAWVASSSSVLADEEFYGIPAIITNNWWYASGPVDVLLSGAADTDYRVKLFSPTNDAARDTTITFGATTVTYDNAGGLSQDPPTAPAEIVVTTDGSGDATITIDGTGTFAYASSITVDIETTTTPGLSSRTLSIEGVLQTNKTGIQRRITAGANLNGVQRSNATDVTTNASGVMPALDLSATAAAVGDTVRDTVLLPSGESISALRTVEDIS
ncbi:hypothetical protein ACTXGQ_04260 [Marinobacter sp. 1Y8]